MHDENTAAVPADIAALVAEWRKAMEGVTPGPWYVRTLNNFGWNVAHYRDGDKHDIVRIAKVGDEADAQHLARCSPDSISALLDALTAAYASLAAARSAHRWNVDDLGNGTLQVCRNEHEKGDPCEWETFVPIIRAEAAEAQLAEALHLLGRYRTETPLGNQPHMITHEVDDFARRAREQGGE